MRGQHLPIEDVIGVLLRSCYANIEKNKNAEAYGIFESIVILVSVYGASDATIHAMFDFADAAPHCYPLLSVLRERGTDAEQLRLAQHHSSRDAMHDDLAKVMYTPGRPLLE